MTGDAGVTINGEKLDGDEQLFRGLVYSRRISDDVDYTFVFTDADGGTYTNSLKLEPIDLDRLPQEISGRESVQISWAGAPVGKFETVRIYASDDENILGMEIGSTSANGANSVKTNPNDVKQLLNGGGSIYIVRSIDKPLDEEGDEGGELRGDYTSESYSIEIVDAKTEAQANAEAAELEQELKELEEELENL